MKGTPFDLAAAAAYQRWRDAKRASAPRRSQDLVVDVADPRRLSEAKRQALLQRCATANMAIYRSADWNQTRTSGRAMARQFGLRRLDGNWLADEDGISPIEVAWLTRR